jgi:methylase of polypeptide subunit release factors
MSFQEDHEQFADDGGPAVKLAHSDEIWMPTIFGTTLAKHVTTHTRDGDHVLELGIGSGIQVLTALLSGAAKATGLDLNPAAVRNTMSSAALNDLVGERLDLRVSNLFDALDTKRERDSFDLLISNPPTFPAPPPSSGERSKEQWEFAGNSGRLILDACIVDGVKWVRRGGKLLIIATSTQSWRQTQHLLAQHWGNYEILQELEIPLAAHYDPHIEAWRRRGDQLGEELIIQASGTWHQRLYFVKATR